MVCYEILLIIRLCLRVSETVLVTKCRSFGLIIFKDNCKKVFKSYASKKFFNIIFYNWTEISKHKKKINIKSDKNGSGQMIIK